MDILDEVSNDTITSSATDSVDQCEHQGVDDCVRGVIDAKQRKVIISFVLFLIGIVIRLIRPWGSSGEKEKEEEEEEVIVVGEGEAIGEERNNEKNDAG